MITLKWVEDNNQYRHNNTIFSNNNSFRIDEKFVSSHINSVLLIRIRK